MLRLLPWGSGSSPSSSRRASCRGPGHRRGHVFTKFGLLETEISHSLRADQAVLDGEIVCLDADGHSNFYHLLFRREWPFFCAFDLLAVDGEDLWARPLVERKRRLRRLMPRVESPLRSRLVNERTTRTLDLRSLTGTRGPGGAPLRIEIVTGRGRGTMGGGCVRRRRRRCGARTRARGAWSWPAPARSRPPIAPSPTRSRGRPAPVIRPQLLQIVQVEAGKHPPFFFQARVHIERQRAAHRHRLRRLPEVIRPDQRFDGRMHLALPEVVAQFVLVGDVVQQLRDERADVDGDAIRRATIVANTGTSSASIAAASSRASGAFR